MRIKTPEEILDDVARENYLDNWSDMSVGNRIDDDIIIRAMELYSEQFNLCSCKGTVLIMRNQQTQKPYCSICNKLIDEFPLDKNWTDDQIFKERGEKIKKKKIISKKPSTKR